MTSIRKFALALVGVLTAAGAVAQSQRQPDSVEQRLEKIEQALARLEAQSGSSRHGSMKEQCRDMMKQHGMMGGMMGRGMHSSPEQK
jgi:hypothetical protein